MSKIVKFQKIQKINRGYLREERTGTMWGMNKTFYFRPDRVPMAY